MAPVPAWSVRGRTLPLDRPLVMGILNVTPDSFSDGGRFFSPESAAERGAAMLGEAADIIDVGGESTRPGATPISEGEELDRVLPVIEALVRHHPDATLSIDTVKSRVARAALDAGAHVVNDVSALRLDPALASVCAATGAGVVLMHSRGGIGEMASYAHAEYRDVVRDVVDELEGQARVARDGGIARDSIVLDPGVGFAKRSEHSLALLAALPRLTAMGYPIMVGVSRKRFIGDLTGVRAPADRLGGTVGANVAALALGARIFRVHDVRENRDALDVAWRILGR